MSVIQTKPSQTLSGIPGTYKTGIIIPASSTLVVDSVIAANNYSLKWIITLIDNINLKTISYEVMAINKFNNSVSHNTYARVGDYIAHGIDVQLNFGNMQLLILNNESNNISASIVRIQTIHS